MPLASLMFDPFAAETLEDPYPSYVRLRDEQPCYRIAGTDIWAVSRYADVEAVLRDHAVFSSTGGVGPDWEPRPMMSMYDPPQHSRLRRSVARHFTPKYLASFVASMSATADKSADELVERGAADFVSDFAEPLVATLIADILGIRQEEREDFRRWSLGTVNALARGLDGDGAARAEQSRREFVGYLKRTVAERRANPLTDKVDILSLLAQAHAAETLTASEVTAFCVLLLVAGFETTVNAIVNSANAVMNAPGAWNAVREEPQLLAGAIEEALRFDSPDQSFFRNTLKDATIAGVLVPERSKVMVLFGAANRDPRKYRDPDVFDVRRNPTDHLAFGSGIHHCIGAPLARLQLMVVARAMMARVRSMSLDGKPVRAANVITRGFRQLPVRVVAL